MSSATCPQHCTPTADTLFVAFELGLSHWHLAFGTQIGGRTQRCRVRARDMEGVMRSLDRARRQFGLEPDARIVSCYEAGRDGFWLDRLLGAADIENCVVDSASIDVDRRARRVKTDRLDAAQLLGKLMRYDRGESKVWSTVNVPKIHDEQERVLHRELRTLVRDRTRHTNRIKAYLAAYGVVIAKVDRDLPELLPQLVCPGGSPVGEQVQRRVLREWERRELLEKQIREIEAEQRRRAREPDSAKTQQVRQLMALRGVGIKSAWLLVMEFFGWREFHNRREVGSLAGLTPTPYSSASSQREQGMSKAGSRWVRGIMIELAWSWIRLQPDSELSRWYRERFGPKGPRMRKVGIVAVARKLLVQLWKYLQTGELPPGAVLKA